MPAVRWSEVRSVDNSADVRTVVVAPRSASRTSHVERPWRTRRLLAAVLGAGIVCAAGVAGLLVPEGAGQAASVPSTAAPHGTMMAGDLAFAVQATGWTDAGAADTRRLHLETVVSDVGQESVPFTPQELS